MISVVIPVFRRCDSVLNLLASLYCQENVSFEVIVVDDHSCDGTAEEIVARFPQTKVLVNEENRGPAASRNQGIRESRGDIVVGLDSDVTVPDVHLLKKVSDAFDEMPKATGFAFRIFNPDGRTDDVARWWHPVPLTQFAGKPFQSNYFSGTGYAFRKVSIVTAGLFPEILFMHYEEVGLALRVMDNGGTILYRPELTALHHAHQTRHKSEIMLFYKPRNQVLITLMFYPIFRGAFYLLPRLGYALWTALKGRHISDFIRAMFSAARLASYCWLIRTQLKAQTWRRMSEMRRTTAKGAPVSGTN